MKIKTSELSDQALVWAVGIADQPDGAKLLWRLMRSGNWRPSSDPAQGHPIIERAGITTRCLGRDINGWLWDASSYGCNEEIEGPTKPVAGLRCFLASRLGDEVEIPAWIVERCTA